MVKEIIVDIIIPAILTIILEMPIVLIGFKKIKCDKQYKLIVFILINLITNLTLNSINLLIYLLVAVIIITEFIIVLIEAFTYKKAFMIKFKDAFVVSLLANLFSGLIGSILLRVIIL